MSQDVNVDFDLTQYPTLKEFTEDDSLIRIVTGPAGCLSGDTEVMTRTGWVRLDEFSGDEALVYDWSTGEAFFDAVGKVQHPAETLWRAHNHHAVDMVFCDDHTIPYITSYARARGQGPTALSGREVAEHMQSKQLDALIPATFRLRTGSEYPLTDDEIRLAVAICADGSLPQRGRQAIVTVRKQRKVERMRYLLKACGIDYEEVTFGSRDTEHAFRFIPVERTKDLTRFYSASARQMEVIRDELLLWDGTVHDKGAAFVSNDPMAVDFAQFAFVSTGVPSVINSYDAGKAGWATTYRATYQLRARQSMVNLRSARIDKVPAPGGMKYCLTTSTGMFVARHNKKVFCTGNSAKTSWMVMEILKLACAQQPAPDGCRYTKFLVGRMTYQVLKSATIDTFRRMAGDIFNIKSGSIPPTADAHFNLPDGTRVRIDIEFISFDSEDAQSKLLGFEPTFVFLDEVSELPESLVEACVRRLGRYPSGRYGTPTATGLFGATNGPKKNHWLYEWHQGKKDALFKELSEANGRNYFRLFMQPPALLRPHKEGEPWKPNPKAENIHNLKQGYGYYFNMLTGSDAAIQSYVEGKFADLVTGKVVFSEFNSELHVLDSEKYVLPAGFPLYLGFDFGRTPVCLIATATAAGGLRVIDELMGEGMSIDTLCQDVLLPTLRQKYRNCWIDGAWGDPAGGDEGQNVDLSPYDILLEHGIPIENPGTNKLSPRLEAVKQAFTRLDSMGKPQLQIRDNCKYLLAAVESDYIYELVRGGGGVVRDTPTKSHVNWVSDLADALQYLCLGYSGVGRAKKFDDLPPLKTKWM